MYYDGIVENISMTESEYSLLLDSLLTFAKDDVDGWMNSPDNGVAILDELLTVQEIGVIILENKILVTENFC